MMKYLDEDTKRKIDDFNASQGGPARIELCWDPRRDRWCVFAIPQDYGTHPLSKSWVTPALLRPFLDGSGRRGVFLNTWQDEHGDYLPVDERLFDALRYADTFRDKEHYENNFKRVEVQKELALEKGRRDIAYGARSYWQGLDRVMVGSGFKGNWKRAKGIL